MSAVPEHFMNDASRENREPRMPNEDDQSSFWHWFALGVLLFCWIAEATMCAERGF